MKPLLKHNPKHKHTFPFHPGNNIATVEPDRVPASHISGVKTRMKQLPPIRNRKIIDLNILCPLLQKYVPKSGALVCPGGLVVHSVEIKVFEGYASTESVKFRFRDVFEFLLNLKMEHLLNCNRADIKLIKDDYNKNNGGMRL